MAQAATMGPPLSPLAREPRRSGRRPAPLFNAIASPTSHSPDPQPLSPTVPRIKEPLQRSTSNGSNRNKRAKQEDLDDALEDHPLKNGTNGATTNSRAKRKGKEKEPEKDRAAVVDINIDEAKNGAADEDAPMDGPDDEQSVTRCICGDEDPEQAGEFMVQCETCNVWQHGLCMGYEKVEDLPFVDYHCERCRPERHESLLKRLSKKMRHASNTSHHNSTSANNSRSSRSHSPSHLLHKPAKRRNTMNSRDAAYDESLQEVIEQSAAEAAAAEAAAHAGGPSSSAVDSRAAGTMNVEGDEEGDPAIGGAKKRKRTEDDTALIKRQRSPSSMSDRPALATTTREETPLNPASAARQNSGTTAAPKSAAARNKRGGRKNGQAADLPPTPGDEEPATTAPKRQANNRTKTFASADHRRNNTSGVGAGTHSNTRGHASTSAAAARAYHQSHEYAVSQQPLYTSWNLPDWLSHLEPMLPSKEPTPLRVTSSGAHGLHNLNLSACADVDGRDSVAPEGVTIERGVKVRWPTKRMSVGDMNKRVRALVEWVGREQVSASERMRRRQALEKALREVQEHVAISEPAAREDRMLMDDERPMTESPVQEKSEFAAVRVEHLEPRYSTQATMKMMEELMEELISFQERFGPGAKTKERERRAAAVS
ncbi:hypothetical protein GLOTRDRAFT_115246 [Gloeophyllum trabeum ATCC 11539]|uniref:Zinc finger PHD-type domain-containing protein n=1 Tax=Gloeophyllum trabeum (strain ATCC 11539 / FP-39264 / Madison 617) TaxID=670483 RepID=S7RRG9_GLOTA|nr:uncharacterized protein GLOTRDRAFT_115246 [Gloeophyllum trabeum ATCC 11539]EPQ57240.1 hypothetical protein GLOTRDRAFT_115246 [Gloeophyllum trabeum ATCC 11539]